MINQNYRLFLPLANFYTRRSEIVLQREINLTEGIPAPRSVEELRHLLDSGQAFPAERGSYCVQYGGNGRYFTTGKDALDYLCTRWRPAFIVRNLEDAMSYAARQCPEALADAAVWAEKRQNRAKAGGGDMNC